MNELLNNAPCGFLAFADDGKVVEANATLLAWLGYERAELLKLHVEKTLSVGARIFYQTHFFPLLKLKGKVEEIYLDLRSRAGENIPVLANAARRAGAGGEFFYDCVFIAIRQRNQYEEEILRAKREAEAATRAKEEFLSVVSHELRTPLNAIIGWSQMLKSGGAGYDHRRAIEAIEQSARIQARLIDDLLDLSRIVAGKLKIEVRHVELGKVIESAIETVTPAAQAKNIRLQKILESNAFVSGDASRLQQVLWNLLSNAVKFTPKQGRIQIRLARVNSSYEISVSDTGSGIGAEFLPYVFERFQQAGNDGASREGGLGLGLAITRHIVELHGGTIRAESAGKDLGTTFTISLPVSIVQVKENAVAVGAASRSEESGSILDASRLEGIRAIVVDDDPDNRHLLTTLLTLHGMKPVGAASVAEAFEKIHSVDPDLVISDIEMPGENGFSLIKKLNELNKTRARKIPAVALTGHAGQAERVRILNAGYQMQLTKPIEPDELLAVIANLTSWNGKQHPAL